MLIGRVRQLGPSTSPSCARDKTAPMSAETIQAGTPVNFGKCWSCREEIAWTLGTRGRKVPIDPEPHRSGSIVLLRDGYRMIDLRDPSVSEQDVNEINESGAPLYVKHQLTCGAPGLRHVGWASKALLDGRIRPDPRRERVRALKLQIEQAREARSAKPYLSR